MKKVFVQKITQGGIDWHDIKIIAKQLTHNCSFEIPMGEENNVIIEDIIKDFPYINSEDLQKAIKTETSFELDPIKNNIKCNETFIEFNGKKKELSFEYMMGQINYVTFYKIEEIEEEDIGYLVEEHFYCPSKGIPLVSRIYHEPFTSLNEAKSYFANMKLHTEFDSNKEIIVISLSNIRNEWFEENIKAIQLMADKHQSPFDNSFSLFVKTHIENLNKI